VEIEDVRRLVDRAFEIEDPTELETLAKERPSALIPFHLRLADSDFRWVADLYRAMTEETAAELVRRLDTDTDPDGLLHMIAAGGTATAVEVFRGLGEPQAGLSRAGGWELTPSGDVRSLTSRVAITLAPSPVPPSLPSSVPPLPLSSVPPSLLSPFPPSPSPSPSPLPSPVSGGRLGVCGWCGFPMWRLLDVDRAVLPDLFGTGPGRMMISTCTLCGNYATIFTEGGRFAAVIERPTAILGKWQPYELDGLPDAPPLGLGAVRPSPSAGNAW
jgi:hypothetical protein